MTIKTIKQLNTIKEYIENTQFSLKDFSKTYDKYKDYKKEKVKSFFEEHNNKIKDFIEDELYYLINDKLEYINNYYTLENELNKSNIRTLRTNINGFTIQVIQEYIKTLDDFNQNELMTFGIIFYLKYYSKINETMKKNLSDSLKDTHEILEIKTELELNKFLICKELEQ